MKTVAIHQPNFFPWLGYFNKIAKSDVFILLDNVQFPKTGGTYMNRVKILVNAEGRWVTMPVVRAFHGVLPVKEIMIDNSFPWRDKLLRTLQSSYGRSPFFEETFGFLNKITGNPTESLLDFNRSTIFETATLLGLDTSKIIVESTLGVDGRKNDLLVALVKKVNGTTYLHGTGGLAYQDRDLFNKNSIELVYQNFAHPEYDQDKAGLFSPGLSIIDALMHCGIAVTRKLIL